MDNIKSKMIEVLFEGVQVSLKDFVNNQPIFDWTMFKTSSTSVSTALTKAETYLKNNKSGIVRVPFQDSTLKNLLLQGYVDKGGVAQVRYIYENYRYPINTESRPNGTGWVVGDIIINNDYITNSCIGWVCTEAGTPGVWKGFGYIKPWYTHIELVTSLPQPGPMQEGRQLAMRDSNNVTNVYYCALDPNNNWTWIKQNIFDGDIEQKIQDIFDPKWQELMDDLDNNLAERIGPAIDIYFQNNPVRSYLIPATVVLGDTADVWKVTDLEGYPDVDSLPSIFQIIFMAPAKSVYNQKIEIFGSQKTIYQFDGSHIQDGAIRYFCVTTLNMRKSIGVCYTPLNHQLLGENRVMWNFSTIVPEPTLPGYDPLDMSSQTFSLIWDDPNSSERNKVLATVTPNSLGTFQFDYDFTQIASTAEVPEVVNIKIVWDATQLENYANVPWEISGTMLNTTWGNLVKGVIYNQNVYFVFVGTKVTIVNTVDVLDEDPNIGVISNNRTYISNSNVWNFYKQFNWNGKIGTVELTEKDIPHGTNSFTVGNTTGFGYYNTGSSYRTLYSSDWKGKEVTVNFTTSGNYYRVDITVKSYDSLGHVGTSVYATGFEVTVPVDSTGRCSIVIQRGTARNVELRNWNSEKYQWDNSETLNVPSSQAGASVLTHEFMLNYKLITHTLRVDLSNYSNTSDPMSAVTYTGDTSEYNSWTGKINWFSEWPFNELKPFSLSVAVESEGNWETFRGYNPNNQYGRYGQWLRKTDISKNQNNEYDSGLGFPYYDMFLYIPVIYYKIENDSVDASIFDVTISSRDFDGAIRFPKDERYPGFGYGMFEMGLNDPTLNMEVPPTASPGWEGLWATCNSGVKVRWPDASDTEFDTTIDNIMDAIDKRNYYKNNSDSVYVATPWEAVTIIRILSLLYYRTLDLNSVLGKGNNYWTSSKKSGLTAEYNVGTLEHHNWGSPQSYSEHMKAFWVENVYGNVSEIISGIRHKRNNSADKGYFQLSDEKADWFKPTLDNTSWRNVAIHDVLGSMSGRVNWFMSKWTFLENGFFPRTTGVSNTKGPSGSSWYFGNNDGNELSGNNIEPYCFGEGVGLNSVNNNMWNMRRHNDADTGSSYGARLCTYMLPVDLKNIY